MAFPPTYNEAWDITQPPDTQAANLLGSDIRNLKNDIMQRLSLLSGLFANRPTPEIVNATWGGAGYGLLYFATDTQQVFQWSGSAWVDVTLGITGYRLFNAQGASAAIVGNGAVQTVFTYNLPASAIGASQLLRIKGSLFHTGSSSVSYNIALNGVSLWSASISNQSTGPGIPTIIDVLYASGATGISVPFSYLYNSGVASVIPVNPVGGLAWGSVQTVTFTFNAPATDSVTPQLWTVEGFG